MARYRPWSWMPAVVALLAVGGCSWFPLVDYPTPRSPAVESPAKTLDLTLSGTES